MEENSKKKTFIMKIRKPMEKGKISALEKQERRLCVALLV